MPSRRTLLAACCLAGLGPLAPRALLAAAPTDRRLVIVILRGAMDGLAAVPAYADPAYRSTRGGLAIAEPGQVDGALNLDGFFGLHPALDTLHGWYRHGEAAVCHAIATSYRERSHFEAQDLLENGTTLPGGSENGWLNRALGLMGAGRRLGLSVGATTPLILRGPAPVAGWSPIAPPDPEADFLARLGELYAQDPMLGPSFTQAMADRALSDEPAAGPDRLPAFSVLAREVGRRLSLPLGERVAALDLGGFDTHAGQGAVTGRLANQLGVLDDGLKALRAGLGDAWKDSLVVTITEFGRTVAVNGTGGTDHGTASVAFVAGGGLGGGRVLADWPGLGTGRLLDGRDLAPTTDLRSLLKTALVGHLGLPGDGVERVVFPGSVRVGPLRDLVSA